MEEQCFECNLQVDTKREDGSIVRFWDTSAYCTSCINACANADSPEHLCNVCMDVFHQEP